MCGITGIVDSAGVDTDALRTMTRALGHRGPDGEGYALMAGGRDLRRVERSEIGDPTLRAPAGLGHRRLTIIDLTEASAQPMLDASGTLALAYNGELYNYVELRRALESRGREFRTTGDTEVVLQAWAEWGAACVERFVGMWAFAIVDARQREVVLCRDRFGIKPLFYTRAHGKLRFASEIKALLAAMPTPDPDEATVAGFLLAARDTEVRTFFDGILRVPAAHTLSVPIDNPTAVRLERYWEIPAGEGVEDPAAPMAFAELFRESVRLHTRSDVPVGTCLSGGLDSSAIVCIAATLARDGVLPSTYQHHAFGYVPPDNTVSERPWMDIVTRRTGVELTEVHPSPNRFADALTTVVRQQDEPFGSTSIAAQWFVFQAAHAAGIKVMLDGQGADEVLGGYHGYLATIAAGMVADGRRLAYARLALDHRRRLGTWPLAPSAALPLVPTRARPLAAAFLAQRNGHAPTPPAIADVMRGGLRDTAETADPVPTEVQELLRQQVQFGGLSSLLRYEDRNSMAHSIEARVPFLDHRLVEYAFRLPGEAKIKNADTKRVLRSAMQGVLPEEIRKRRDKLGFRADPAAAARFAAARRDELRLNASEVEAGWFDESAVGAFIDTAQRDGTLDFPLWRIVNVKLWARAHWGSDGR